MNPWSEPNDSARVMTGSRMAAIEKLEPRVSLTAVGYRPQEPSIASSPEDTRLAICQFEFLRTTRIKVRDRQMKRLKYGGFRTDFSYQTNSTGVTQTEDLKLSRKLPRNCPAAPEPRRSLATTVCRPIRVRYTCFSGVLARMPSLPDRYRSSSNIAN
jgi:hypothetical protein